MMVSLIKMLKIFIIFTTRNRSETSYLLPRPRNLRRLLIHLTTQLRILHVLYLPSSVFTWSQSTSFLHAWWVVIVLQSQFLFLHQLLSLGSWIWSIIYIFWRSSDRSVRRFIQRTLRPHYFNIHWKIFAMHHNLSRSVQLVLVSGDRSASATTSSLLPFISLISQSVLPAHSWYLSLFNTDPGRLRWVDLRNRVAWRRWRMVKNRRHLNHLSWSILLVSIRRSWPWSRSIPHNLMNIDIDFKLVVAIFILFFRFILYFFRRVSTPHTYLGFMLHSIDSSLILRINLNLSERIPLVLLLLLLFYTFNGSFHHLHSFDKPIIFYVQESP